MRLMARGSIRFVSSTLLLATALGLPACGQAPNAVESGGELAQPIVGGEVDTQHKNVFMLFASLGRFYSTCTATLIAPNLLLTARHCVASNVDEAVVCGQSELGAPYAAETLRASNPVDVNQATRWFEGGSVHVPTEGSDTCGYDVALLVLTENVPPSVAVPAIPRIDLDVEEGEPYVAVGYGLDEAGEAGGRLARDGLFVECAPGQCGRVAPVREFIGDTGVCQGDSGGPAFDTKGKLVGIVSRGGEDCSVPIYGAVTAWRDLITSVALQAAARGNYVPPFWVTSGMSDPPAPLPVEPGGACGPGALCPAGYLCHSGDEGDAPSCTAICSSELDCDAGYRCAPAGEDAESVCTREAPPSGEPDATCAFTVRGRSSETPLPLLGIVVGLAGLRARRRRRVLLDRSVRL
jgi:hypothetical protein